MRLSDEEAARLQIFFREFFRDDNLVLPPIRLYSNFGARVLTSLVKAQGITFGTRIFIAPRQIMIDAEEDACRIATELCVHEATHVLQFERDGYARFLYKYLSEYFAELWRARRFDAASRRRAYLDIEAEREARRAAQSFCLWCASESDSSDDSELRLVKSG